MAVIGSASKASRGSPYGSSTDDDLPLKQQLSPKPASFVDSDASDDTRNNEKGSEICQIGEETCALPIDLFDLPDLTKILSLESWNYCLTEEEREFLVSLLPPLDEEDFRTTMRDLLGGQNFHFGSPLADLFEKLRGGCCTPQVARYSEALKYVQMKSHYHLLRKYHNQMVDSFLEMQKSWEHCPKSADIGERLEIWSSWKSDKLNPQPLKVRGGTVKKPAIAQNFGKKVGLPEARRVEVIPAPALLAVPPSAVVTAGSRMGSKGVLKMKVIAPRNDRLGDSKPGPVGEPETVKVPAPKGVLKLTSKALVHSYTKPETPAKEMAILTEPKREPVLKETRVMKGPRGPKAPKEPKASKAAKGGPEIGNLEDGRGSNLEPMSDKKKRNNAEKKRKKKEEDEERFQAEVNGGQQMYGERQQIFEDDFRTLHGDPDSFLEEGRKKKVKVQRMDEGGYHMYDDSRTLYKEAQVIPPEGRKKKKIKIEPGQQFGVEGHQIYEQGRLLYEDADVLHDQGGKKKVKVNSEAEDRKIYDGHQINHEVEEGFPDDTRRKKVKVSQDAINQQDDGRKVKKVKKPSAEMKVMDEWKGSEEKSIVPVKKKVQRRKVVDEKKKAREITDIMDAEDVQNADDNPVLIDLMKEDLHYGVEQSDAPENQVPKAAPRKRSKKKSREPREEAILLESAPDSPRERGASVKSSKKLSPLSTPSIASTFSFSVTHLLSAVRMALILPSGDVTSDFHNQNIAADQSFGYDKALLGSSDDLSLEHNEHSPVAFVNGVSQLVDGTHIEGESRIQDLPTGVFGDELSHLVTGSDLDREGRNWGVSFAEIVMRVQRNPGDPCILQTDEPLHNLVRGALKVFSSRTAPAGAKGWKPLANFERESRTWTWIGPIFLSSSFEYPHEIQITAEQWGISQKTFTKMEEVFAIWLRHGQETLQQVVQLPLPPSPVTQIQLDEKERFRDLRAQKSLVTINPSSDDMRAYFRREEVLRYSLPDRAFPYTTADGRKSVVAPLRRGGGKPTSKARDHFILKPDRPAHVTILCLVRDAAARLPGSIGTRADVCTLIRDSQYIVEDVTDAQVNQVVSGALDRLHYERDPCVKFDGERKLWMYLHTERQEEDFEDDGTSSTKRWKKPRKESAENGELEPLGYDNGSPSGADQEGYGSGMGMEMNSPDDMGDPHDPSAIYSAGRTELVYSKSSSLSSPRVLISVMDSSTREESVLPFLELPPSLLPALHNTHSVAWERVGSTAPWLSDHHHLHPHDPLGEEDYDAEAAAAAQRDADAMIDTDTE